MEGDYDHIVNRGSLYVKRYLHVRNPCLAEPAHDATVPSAKQRTTSKTASTRIESSCQSRI
jgi:hypothetical protein